MDFDLKMALESLLREQQFILSECNPVDEAVGKCLSAENQDIADLQSVPGVGPVLARSFVSGIFQPETFPDSGHPASFLGLVPILKQSGRGKATGNIVTNGQSR